MVRLKATAAESRTFPGLWLLHPLHLIGMEGAATGDRDVLAGDKPLVTEAEARLVVPLALLVVEVPLATRLAAQPADAILTPRTERSYPTLQLILLPRDRVDAPVVQQRHQQVVAFLPIAGRAPLLARQDKANVAKVRGQLGCRRHDWLPGFESA